MQDTILQGIAKSLNSHAENLIFCTNSMIRRVKRWHA